MRIVAQLLPEIILPGGGALKGVVILSQLVVVSPQTVDLLLPLGVGVDQPHDGVPQLIVEGVTGIVGGIEVVVHPAACKIQTVKSLRSTSSQTLH